MKVLSICIPTRNRQACAIDAVRNMLRSERTDFEILLADNSDDAAPLVDFASSIVDPRLRLLAPEARVLSVAENWGRLVPAAAGEWITLIGDDDYADPEICELICATVKRVPLVDAIGWGRSRFVWPDARKGGEITQVATGSTLDIADKKELMRRLFFWQGATNVPDCPFGVYHGAVRKSLMQRICETFSDVCFEQASPQHDNACKVVMLADSLVLWERPMSVSGTCRASHSMGFRDATIGIERMETLRAENPGLSEAADFPFAAHIGPTATVAQAIECFKQRYGIDIDGWETNFIQACARDCETCPTPQQFTARKLAYSDAIKLWRGEAALAEFLPEFKWRPNTPRFQGHVDKTLYFDMEMGEPQTAAEFYDVIDAMLFPVMLLDAKLA